MNPRKLINTIAWSTLLLCLPAAGLTAQSASAVSRSGAGNMNSWHTCAAPRIGQSWNPSVVNYPSTFAFVVGTTGTATTPYLSETLLVDLNSTIVLQSILLNPSGFQPAYYGGVVPNDPGLIGLQFSTQAAVIDMNLGPNLHLTNACDMVVGT